MKNGRTGMVRSLVLAIIISTASFTSFGQVKVGDSPAIIDGNAVLEVESTNKGVLIPRVLLNDAATIAPLTGGSVAEGMLIYSLGGTEPNGFYYWNGTQWVALAESITTLADDGNGGYTYTSEDGTQTSFNAPSVHVSNGTGAPTGTGTAGDIYVDDATGDIYTYNGTTGAWENQAENVTTLADNGDGTHTYTSEDGTATTFNTPDGSVSTGTGAPSGSGTGGDIYVDDATGDIYTYNGTSGAWENQAETTTSLVQDTVAGTMTYIDEQGTQNVLDLGALVNNQETTTSLVQDTVAGTMTYTDEQGTQNVLDLGALVNNQETITSLVQDTVAGTMTYTDEQGTQNVLNLGALVNNQETTTSLVQDTVAGTMTYTDEQGTQNVLDLGALVNNQETTTSLVQDTVAGTMTYTDEQGTQNVLDLGALVNNQETVTTLVDNGDGTHTYTSEDGTNTNINTRDGINSINDDPVIGSFAANEVAGVVYSGDTISMVNTLYNPSSTLSISQGSVVVGEAGYYRIDVVVEFLSTAYYDLAHNGLLIRRVHSQIQILGTNSASTSIVRFCQAGDMFSIVNVNGTLNPSGVMGPSLANNARTHQPMMTIVKLSR